jgi:S-adenosylmethionine:tRNA ribosyltransferase-isomerase
MRLDQLQYDLAPESIAQAPAEDPESARLLDLSGRAAGSSDATSAAYLHVRDLPERIPQGSLVVVNDTRVRRARLLGHKRASGGKVEIFLLRRLAGDGEGGASRWSALGRASKGLPVGTEVDFEGLTATVAGHDAELLEVDLRATDGGSVEDAIERVGHVPLPPYVRREDDAVDTVRYQTMFARALGAVAAPTAGLHLTPGIVDRLAARGCAVTTVTLHVGLGTFQPVTVADLDDHPMHAEAYDVPVATADAVAAARDRGAPVVAIGTTVVRALESAADLERPGLVRPNTGETRLLVQPGYRFRVVDRLFTNFHMPGSTLLALVAAFAGTRLILDAYADAQRRGFRFFSYGDAMLLSRAHPGATDARREP